MAPKVAIVDPVELDERIQSAVEKALEEKLPKIVREAVQKEYLNTREVKDQFCISYRAQKHLRDTNQISFSQHGRMILYKRSDIQTWVNEHKVTRKRKNND